MKRSVSVWLLCLIAVALLIPIPGISGEEIDLHDTDPVPDLGMPLIVEHIKIEGDEDLKEKAALYQWPGSGTEEDPITISGFRFQNIDFSYCPIINDTNLHIRINKCHFSNSKDEYGYFMDYFEGAVLIQRSSNISVENCSSDSIQVLVRAEESRNIRISNNTVMYGFGGVIINRCQTTVIEDNLINDIGIIISDSYGTVIRNNSIFQYGAKLSIDGSTNTIVEDNDFIYSEVRFIIEDSRETFISGNRLLYSRGLEIEGDEETYETLYIGENNFVNDGPLLSVRDTSNIGLIGPFGQLFLINITDTELNGNGNIHFPDQSIINLVLCRNVTFSLVNSSYSQSSIRIYFSSECTVENGYISNGEYAVRINRSTDINIRNFVFMETAFPITLEESASCIIDNVTIVTASFGVRIKDSSYNHIINSHINGGYVGISISGSSYHNNIINSTLWDTTLSIPSIYDIYNAIYHKLNAPPVDEIIRTLSIKGTTLNDRSILKLNDVDMAGRKISENVGCLILLNVTNLDVKDLTMVGRGYLLYMIDCENIDVSNCNINSSRYHSIMMIRSRQIKIHNCSIIDGGILIEESSSISITLCEISTKSDSIQMVRSENIVMNEINVLSSDYVLISYECIDTSISNSSFDGSASGIDIWRSSGFSGYNLSLTVEGLAIHIRESENSRLEGSKFSGEYSSLEISQSSGDRIINNTFEICSYNGVDIENWYDSVFSNNTIEGRSADGINIRNSMRCVISHLILGTDPNDNWESGLNLYNVSEFMVENNTITGFKSSGIYALIIHDSMVQNNRLYDNGCGISISSGIGNLIRWNDCVNNTRGSICLITRTMLFSQFISSNNTIYGNLFIDNWTIEEFQDQYKHPARDNGVNNTWYSEKHGGNYWTWIRGPDLDRDGFVDYPFIINGTAGSEDRYPIAHPNPVEKNNGGFPFIPDIMISTVILIFILLILAGSHKIGFHFKKDPDLNGD